MDYLDLYLIHRPRGEMCKVHGKPWKNFTEPENQIHRCEVILDAAQLNDLIKNNKVKPTKSN